MSTVEVLQFPLLGVGVHFDLVHRGDDLGLIEQSLQTDRQEVADADSAQLSVGKQGFQCFVGRDGLVELGRVGLVQDEQINLLEAELRRRLLKSVQRLIVSVVGDPNLGLDEDVRAVEAGTAQRLPDPLFVAVGSGSVDVAVSDLEGSLHSHHRFLGRGLVDTKANLGKGDAVVQCEVRLRGGHGLVLSNSKSLNGLFLSAYMSVTPKWIVCLHLG